MEQDAKLKSVPEIETLQGAILMKGKPSTLYSTIFLTSDTRYLFSQINYDGTQAKMIAVKKKPAVAFLIITRIFTAEELFIKEFSSLPEKNGMNDFRLINAKETVFVC